MDVVNGKAAEHPLLTPLRSRHSESRHLVSTPATTEAGVSIEKALSCGSVCRSSIWHIAKLLQRGTAEFMCCRLTYTRRNYMLKRRVWRLKNFFGFIYARGSADADLYGQGYKHLPFSMLGRG